MAAGFPLKTNVALGWHFAVDLLRTSFSFVWSLSFLGSFTAEKGLSRFGGLSFPKVCLMTTSH